MVILPKIAVCTDDVRAYSGLITDAMVPLFTHDQDKYEKEICSYWGPVFVLDGNINSPSYNFPGSGVAECQIGLQRLLALRAPDVPGEHQQLIRNQRRAMRTLRVDIHKLKIHIHSRIQRVTRHDAYAEWVNKPHPKRKLRMRTEVENCEYANDNRDDFADVVYKLKKGERLAQGKKRCIGDLGPIRTSVGAWIIDSYKDAFAQPVMHGAHEFNFVKSATKESLKYHFQRMESPGDGLYFCAHSDDCSWSYMCSDGLLMVDGDVKSCDGSHYSIIRELERLMVYDLNGVKVAYARDIERTFRYLSLPIEFRNPMKRSEKFRIAFRSPKLYSGSVLTTLLNTFANYLIYSSMKRELSTYVGWCTKEQALLAYVEGARNVGYLVKTKVASCIEQTFFLKHSCSVVDGEYEPWMGLGTFYRGYGSCYGELNGRGPFLSRAVQRNSEVALGRRNWGNHCVNDSFSHLIVGPAGDATRVEQEKSIGESVKRIPVDALCRRYDISEGELFELCRATSLANVGHIINLPVLWRIYSVDYG